MECDNNFSHRASYGILHDPSKQSKHVCDSVCLCMMLHALENCIFVQFGHHPVSSLCTMN